MRTKALIITAALSAAAVANSLAQVYSVNAVGYVNVTVKRGYNLVANPLKNGDNTLATLIPSTSSLPEGTQVLTWNAAGGTTGTPDGAIPEFFPGPIGEGGWEPAGPALPPGKAFWMFVPLSAPQQSYTITFVGEVAEGALTTEVRGGNRYNALASQVPQAGKITTDLKFQAQDGDQAFIWDKSKSPGTFLNTIYEYVADASAWSDGVDIAEPSIGVGDGFFLFRKANVTVPWTRTFDVDNPN
jgi:hypothetical protein